MTRFISGLIFLVAGGGIHHYNSTHTNSVVVLPLDLVMPSVVGNPVLQGRYTVMFFVGFGTLLLLNGFRLYLRDRSTEAPPA